MDSTHGHVRLKSDLFENGWEELPARQEGPNMRLLSSPIALTGLAANDLIRVDDDGSFQLVERGGFVSVQVFIDTAAGGELDWMQIAIDDFGSVDNVRETTFVLNFAVNVGHARITALMARFLEAFPGCLYQYGNVFDEKTQEPLDGMQDFLAR